VCVCGREQAKKKESTGTRESKAKAKVWVCVCSSLAPHTSCVDACVPSQQNNDFLFLLYHHTADSFVGFVL